MSKKKKNSSDKRQKNFQSPAILAVLEEAAVHHQAGRLAEAEQLYKQVLAVDPENADALHLIGVLAHQVGQSAVGIELINRAIRSNNRDPAFYFNLGNISASINNPEEAKKAYEKSLSLDPDNADAWNGFATALYNQNMFEEAEKAYKRAIKLAPHKLEAQINLGNIYKMQGLLDKASACYEQALNFHPNSSDAYNNLGTVFDARGELEEAEKNYKRAIDLNPQNSDAHNNIGNIYKTRQDFDAAFSAYWRSIKINPDFVNAHNAIKGVLYQMMLQGRAVESIEKAKVWAEAFPDNAIALHTFSAIAGDNKGAPARASDRYVADVFDIFAKEFDSVLTSLGYNIPSIINDMIERSIPEAALDILDAGCGTGLSAKFLRPKARTLTGVDLSSEMLKKAAEHKAYDCLEKAELTDFLTTHTELYDLIVMADVLIYFGDLQPAMRAASEALCKNGHLAFSVEALQEPNEKGWHLFNHGRYAHSEANVRACLSAAGFHIIDWQNTVMRLENGKPAEGFVVLAKNSA